MNWLRKLWTPRKVADVAPVVAPEPEPPPAPPDTPIAFISDIHGNLQALQAVLADIEAQGVSEVICLGDIVGYGGNPGECVQLIRSAGMVCIRGNHDGYVAGTDFLPPGRGPEFEEQCAWARGQVGEDGCNWLGGLPLTHAQADFEAVHTSLHHPDRWPYILLASDAAQHFARQTAPVTFAGHTHKPLMWIEGEERALTNSLESLRLDRKQAVNVGAVGQSRDGNPDACYVIYHRKEREVRWRRIPYDIAGAQEAIIKACLPPKNAARLEVGK